MLCRKCLSQIYEHSMKNTNNSSNRRGFAAMDPDKRKEVAKRGGQASRSKEEINNRGSEIAIARGFAAMDEEKRKEIAKRGGSVSRRNRMAHKDQVVIL